MRRMLANAMLCLLLLLSVAVVRCEAQCSSASMPMVMQPATSADSAMAMDSGMEHCAGMQIAQEGTPALDAACQTPMCQHQALPSTAASRGDLDVTQAVQPIAVPVAAAVLLRAHPSWDGFDRPPLPRRSPLDQSSSLRV